MVFIGQGTEGSESEQRQQEGQVGSVCMFGLHRVLPYAKHAPEQREERQRPEKSRANQSSMGPSQSRQCALSQSLVFALCLCYLTRLVYVVLIGSRTGEWRDGENKLEQVRVSE